MRVFFAFIVLTLVATPALAQDLAIAFPVFNEPEFDDPVSQAFSGLVKAARVVLKILAQHRYPEPDIPILEPMESVEKLRGILVMLPAVIPDHQRR